MLIVLESTLFRKGLKLLIDKQKTSVYLGFTIINLVNIENINIVYRVKLFYNIEK